MNATKPGLFGLVNTNRDFSDPASWGKNQFNSSFPTALCCYLHSQDIEANYLAINQQKFAPTMLSISSLFGIAPDNDEIFFAFETTHAPFQKYVIGTLPRTDLVIQNRTTGQCIAGLEIKLTALPDNTTHTLADAKYGSEIVVRPDSIVYLACSLASGLGAKLQTSIPQMAIADWSDPQEVLSQVPTIVETIEKIALALEKDQSSFLVQPIWKTVGKSPTLADNCLDVFVWSDAGFAWFIAQLADRSPEAKRITRATRTAIWLFKMLHDIAYHGHCNHTQIIDTLSYNTKNDKAFASAGNVTNPFMACPRLTHPIVKKNAIKAIILGNGHRLLSPERRFDAILVNSPALFA